MLLESLATAVPEPTYSQAECWEIVRASRAARRLRPRSRELLRKVLTGPSGIQKRHFAIDPIDTLFDLDAESLNRHFEAAAPGLGGQALERALEPAGWRPEELDALFVCTCTGYLCPGVSSYIAEQCGLRPDAFLQDIVGLGCGASVPTLRSAAHFLAANPAARVAVVAVEICSAAFYLDDDPGVLISACLFSDGAAAALWSGDSSTAGWRASRFRSHHDPARRDCLRMENRGGFLRNRLHKSVPARAADAVRMLFPLPGDETVDTLLAHPGGRDVLAAIGQAVPGYSLEASARVLRQHGNMSSPSLLFVLEELIRDPQGASEAWLTSFGAGFSCHGFRLSRASAPGDCPIAIPDRLGAMG